MSAFSNLNSFSFWKLVVTRNDPSMTDAVFSRLIALRSEEDVAAGQKLRTGSGIRRTNRLRPNASADHGLAVRYTGNGGLRGVYNAPATTCKLAKPPAYPVWHFPRHVMNKGIPAYDARGDMHCTRYFLSPTVEDPSPTTLTRPPSTRPKSAGSRRAKPRHSLANGFGASLSGEGLRIIGEPTEHMLVFDYAQSSSRGHVASATPPSPSRSAPSPSPSQSPPKVSPGCGHPARPASAKPTSRATIELMVAPSRPASLPPNSSPTSPPPPAQREARWLCSSSGGPYLGRPPRHLGVALAMAESSCGVRVSTEMS